jgi:hypothetical protein
VGWSGIPAALSAAWGDNHPMSAFPPLETVEEIQRLFEPGIPRDDPDRDLRLGWASQLAQLMVRVAELRYRQARGRNIARVLARLAAGVTAAVTTLTGGTLLAQVHGPAATALGLIAVILGVLGAVIAATRPGQSYSTDVVMAAQYEGLWWNIYGFGATELTTVRPAEFAKAWNGFTHRHETISSTPGSGAS